MYVTGLRVEGLRAAEGLVIEQPGVVATLARGPHGLAALDVLDLLVATCDPTRTAEVMARLQIVDTAEDVEVIIEDGLPVQGSWALGDAATLVDPDVGRTVRARVDLALDPLLFGQLREHALRDPRLVSALDDASLSIRFGWIFSNDLQAVSIGLLGVTLGSAAFPGVGPERPKWLPGLLRDVAGRIHRVSDDDLDVVAERLLEASLSPEPEQRRRAARVAAALEGAPFHLGRLELTRVRDQVVPCFGPDLLRARHLGQAAAQSLRLVEAVLLDQPDVLLVEAPGSWQADPVAITAWLHDATQGEHAVLEQVLIAQGGVEAPA